MKLYDIIDENFVANLARSAGPFFTGVRRPNAPAPIVKPKKQNKKKKKDKKKNAPKRTVRSKRSR